ncbi:MAG: pyridoxamine 5'-phosphate oxidase family protein [Tissierellia bacterium]|nr:pyridoxamine 5'-phosphate oxidase family protein [Tissierellia bacterium]
MFRPIQRKDQALSKEETLAIVKRGTHGVLALLGDQDYPYSLPLSYLFREGKFYFHTAKAGHKIDALKNSDKASFCIVDQDQVVPEEFTSYFRSAIAFGRISILEDPQEKREAILLLSKRYYPGASKEEVDRCMTGSFDQMDILVLEVEDLKGKEAIELVREKKAQA